MDKLLIAFIAIIIISSGIYFGSQYFKKPAEIKPLIAVNNFNECLAAKYTITGNLPQICTTPDGKKFTEDIGNILEMTDKIKVSQPKPNTRIASPTTVIGDARGTWFFEGQFPVVVADANGKELGRGIAHAYQDWMTENFIPFDATFEFDIPSTLTGNLILKKDNPSGLTENDAQLKIPIRFR